MRDDDPRWQHSLKMRDARIAELEVLVSDLVDGLDDYWITLPEGKVVLERVAALTTPREDTDPLCICHHPKSEHDDTHHNAGCLHQSNPEGVYCDCDMFNAAKPREDTGAAVVHAATEFERRKTECSRLDRDRSGDPHFHNQPQALNQAWLERNKAEMKLSAAVAAYLGEGEG